MFGGVKEFRMASMGWVLGLILVGSVWLGVESGWRWVVKN